MKIKPYIALARPSHWLKSVFVIPGIFLAHVFDSSSLVDAVGWNVLLALMATCLVASGNYVINEILDARFDKFHPDKSSRPIPSGDVVIPLAYLEFAGLTVLGLAIGFYASVEIGACVLALWVMGLVYNVPPLRLKDRPYVDVLTESINNPIRLAIGWYSTGLHRPPTLSAIVAYWMFGAFLMAAKRFAEYRHIGDAIQAGKYRRSFRHYTEEYLLLSILFYTTIFGMSGGVFMARYRIELVLAIPFVALAMSQYIHVAFKVNSPVQHPEKLHRDRKLFLVVALAFLVCTLLLLCDVPQIESLFQPWGQSL